jgi:putative ABC transport system substrate-binding protein
MKRRAFITLVGGAAATWPIAAHAEQRERMRRIGALMTGAADDAEHQARFGAFLQGLQQAGWIIGRNVRVDSRWATTNADIRKYAAELVALAPDVILAGGGTTVPSFLEATGTVPIVFTLVADPVGAGFVATLAKPGGNITGFANFEFGIAGKWLELLKEIAPRVTRVAVIRDASVASGPGQLGALQGAAASLGAELIPIGTRDSGEIERGINEFARGLNNGLIVPAGGAGVIHRDLIVRLAAHHQIPAVYSDRIYVAGGGLTSYGPDRIEQFRQAAGYVDRIMKGEKPGDLPVQAPTKYETVINLKTAKALGLDVPPTLLARADEVIE